MCLLFVRYSRDEADRQYPNGWQVAVNLMRGSTSNVHSLGKCRAQEGLSQSLRWAACIIAMNALQRSDMGADAVLANDSSRIGILGCVRH